MMNRRFAISLACVFAVVAGCDRADDKASAQGADDDLSFPVEPFTLTSQDNQPFGTEQLKGKTWIATLFFTECPGPCPMMAMRLRDIQNAVDDPDVQIVSVSCDPAKDTPETLKQYGKNVGAKEGRWHFLTGTPEQVKKVATQHLKLGYEPGDAKQPIVHSTRFLLVDGTGTVRGIYDTEDDASMAKLKEDAKKLAKGV